MEYLFIIIFQLIGIGFNAIQKMIELDKRKPDDSPIDVLNLFIKEDWLTLICSALILILHIGTHVAFSYYNFSFTEGEYYILWSAILIPLVLGYAGQELVYKALGKSKNIVMNKIDNFDGNA